MLALSLAAPLVVGVGNGAAFGLVAIGLVLLYKSGGVFNFAAGEFVTLGGYGMYLGRVALGLPYPVAMVVGVAFGLVAGVVTERLVVRPLAERPSVTVLVATAAVTIVVIPLELMLGGARPFPAPPAVGGLGPQVLGVFVSPQQLVILGALLAAGAGLAWFFGRTDLGLATLAASEDATAARLMGVRVERISRLTWGMAGGLGALAGVLLPPLTSTFTPGFGTTGVLIPAFAGAVVGGMTSVPGAFVGSLLVGVVQALAQFNVPSATLPGASSVAVLAVLVAVLVVRPRGLLGRAT